MSTPRSTRGSTEAAKPQTRDRVASKDAKKASAPASKAKAAAPPASKDKKEKAPPAKKSKTSSEHPTYMEMVTDAIVESQERDGLSRAALKKYCYERYGIEETNSSNAHLTAAIKRGVESGSLSLPKGVHGKVKLVKSSSDKENEVAPKKTTARSAQLAKNAAKAEKAQKSAAAKKPIAKAKATATKSKAPEKKTKSSTSAAVKKAPAKKASKKVEPKKASRPAPKDRSKLPTEKPKKAAK